MKIAHIADIHMGLGYPGPSPDSRFDDICRVLDWCADRMIEEKVDVCLFAGDAFKDAKVMLDRAYHEISAFYRWITTLANNGIHVVAISGTPSHDAIAAYELMKEMSGDAGYGTIFTQPGIADEFRWGSYVSKDELIPEDTAAMTRPAGCGGFFVDGHHKLNVVCIPGMNRSNIMTREEYRDMTTQEIHRLMSSKIVDIAQGLRAQVENKDWPTILLTHLTYAEADTGFDQLLMEHEPILTQDAVQGFDLVCLGHIHRAQQIGGKNIFYAGSPERLSFNEEDETPGFWIHELGGESTFIETPARRYITFDYSHEPDSGALDIRYLLERSTVWNVDGAIVRVRAKATEEQAQRIDRKAIERDMYEGGAFFVQEIKVEVERAERARDREVTESLAPVDAVSKWGRQQQMDTDEIDALRGLTLELLQEVAG